MSLVRVSHRNRNLRYRGFRHPVTLSHNNGRSCTVTCSGMLTLKGERMVPACGETTDPPLFRVRINPRGNGERGKRTERERKKGQGNRRRRGRLRLFFHSQIDRGFPSESSSPPSSLTLLRLCATRSRFNGSEASELPQIRFAFNPILLRAEDSRGNCASHPERGEDRFCLFPTSTSGTSRAH